MRVKQILAGKIEEGVSTIGPEAHLQDVALILGAKRIGVLVVSDDGQSITGMISERDIVRALGRLGASALNLPVDQVMTRKVITCGLEDEATVVLEKMTLGRFRHLPVVTEGKLVGLISIGDVVKQRLSELDMEKRSLEGMIMGF